MRIGTAVLRDILQLILYGFTLEDVCTQDRDMTAFLAQFLRQLFKLRPVQLAQGTGRVEPRFLGGSAIVDQPREELQRGRGLQQAAIALFAFADVADETDLAEGEGGGLAQEDEILRCALRGMDAGRCEQQQSGHHQCS